MNETEGHGHDGSDHCRHRGHDAHPAVGQSSVQERQADAAGQPGEAAPQPRLAREPALGEQWQSHQIQSETEGLGDESSPDSGVPLRGQPAEEVGRPVRDRCEQTEDNGHANASVYDGWYAWTLLPRRNGTSE